ncbi:hypothetical protein TRFO_28022 [Tritrichomonas foetus]|uniref:Intimal thickness related receptor IRP domain-containing protein n=1 Tax=Tritrichomonas foetus TaxID=1144522 RepID=A0A1J4K4T4_9EUKA|nr:hypothetical protein TRFO_28022 [Tritrichomonas foetus]|eukprot:OHT04509.1 hypothetical protein TRFO_28022 [Tritrichomonas foetus]
MMICLLFLTLKSWYAINQDSQSLSLPTYTFQKGGNFYISLDKAAADFIYIGLCTIDELKTVQTLSNLEEKLCIKNDKIVDISEIVSIINSKGSFNGNISNAGVYRTIFYTCGQTFSKFEVQVRFQNPLSYLSADIQPCLYSKLITFGILALVLILWTINWIKNFTIRNLLHSFITISLVLNFSYLLIHYFEIRHKDKSDVHTPLTEIRIFLICSSQLTLFSVLLMAAKGWRIVCDTLNVFQILSCFLLSLLTVVPLTIIDSVTLFNYEIPVLLINVFFTAMYMRDLMSSISKATLKVYAHLLIISRSGIDATTTPIFYKSKMFRALSWSLVAYFLLVSLTMIISHIFYISYWVVELIRDILNVFVISSVAWFFRLHIPRSKDYMMLQEMDTSDEEPATISMGEIHGLNTKSLVFKKGKKKWEKGITLPQQPILSDFKENDEINSEKFKSKENEKSKVTDTKKRPAEMNDIEEALL